MTARIGWIFAALFSLAACGDDDVVVRDAGMNDDGGNACASGTMLCDGACVDTLNSTAHCGACGNACAVGQACVAGSCGTLCPGSQTVCDGRCIDTASDRRHCGGCGMACGSGEICVGSACEIACPPDQTVCGTACVDIQSSPLNCGGCGTACSAGEVCSEGACATACAAGLMECSAACVDTQTSAAHCGACDAACTTTAPDASGLCLGGACRLVCDALYGDCNADLRSTTTDGCETPLATDPGNCGACNRRCILPNALPGCDAGACVISSCSPGFADCDADALNGCEVSTFSDDTNCGGCGITCMATERCVAGACEALGGESCTDAIALTSGANRVVWTATMADHFTSSPSCSSSTLTGPDVVMSYTATTAERVTLVFEKPASNRWSAVVSTAACGTLSSPLACMSESVEPALAGSFDLAAGETAYIYLRDTTSGDWQLDNPLDVTVAAIDCATDPPPSAIELSPADMGTARVNGTFRVKFDGVVDPAIGTVAITGNMGTSLSYDLSTSPSEVTFLGENTIMEIDPATALTPGESLTVTLTGMVGGVCAGSGTITSPSWTVTVATPSCTPGMGGMVGTNVTRYAGPVSGSEYYVVPDEDPAGWVYMGGTSELHRQPKAGGPAQDVEALAGLSTSHLGYTMMIDGNDIYTIESKTSGTMGHILRISRDGGTTWAIEDYAMFPTSPNDDFRAATLYQGRIYLCTDDSAATEIWSMPAGASSIPVMPTLEFTLPGVEYCSSITRDSSYYYIATYISDRIWRVPTHGHYPVVLSESEFDFSATANSIIGVDLSGNGLFDIIYVHTYYEEVEYLCDPAGTAPYAAQLVGLGTGSSNYGMGYDTRANTLWTFDDDSEEFISIR